MRIFSKNGKVKRYSPCLPKHISRLLVFLFLTASVVSVGASSLFLPVAVEAQVPQKAILHRHHPLVQEAIEVQKRHTVRLMGIRDVLGTGIGMGADGLPVIKVFTTRPGVLGIPEWLDSVPVQVEVTGRIIALGDTTARYRPAPIGVSTGHPAITAGTIGARVKDTNGRVFALSNNHVYANQNEANLGDSALQPGPYDGASDTDFFRMGTLYDYEPIDFTFSGENTMDAAIALSSTGELSNSTLPDGYGTPHSQPTAASVGLPVQKYGRTTGMTYGTVDAINVFVEVCYEQWWILCVKSAYFYDQVQISPAGFSGGGDSGSLIVTNDGNNNPVGLLFAGSDTTTFANRIDLVLNRFGVTIDDETGPTPVPPAAPSDLTATALSDSQINLAWKDNSDNEAGFKIERCTGSGCGDFGQIAMIGASVTSYLDKSVSALTTYTYRVRAFNSAGDSENSNEASATTSASPTLPAAPSGLTATAVSRNQINLSWTDNSFNEEGFKVERCKGVGCTNFAQIAAIGSNVQTYTDTSLRRKTTYSYRVRAYNAVGNSSYSNTASAKTF